MLFPITIMSIYFLNNADTGISTNLTIGVKIDVLALILPHVSE